MTLKLALDKGHGGEKPDIYYDPGAVGNGMQEATLVSKIGDYVIAELSKYDDVVIKVMPRPSSKVSSSRLNPRPDAAKAWGANLFVSLHINAGGGTGFESFIYTQPNPNTKVTQIIHDEISKYFTDTLKMTDRGHQRKNLAVLRRSSAQMPAILIEYGFIDAAKDAGYLKQEKYLKEMGVVTARAIAKAFGLKLKSTTPPAPVKNYDDTGFPPCKVTIGDRKLSTLGIIYKGLSYVPLRAISDVTGAPITWIEANKPALRGVAVETYYNYKGTGYAHSVEVAKILGRNFTWDNSTNTITII